jgi:hypothetical protein
VVLTASRGGQSAKVNAVDVMHLRDGKMVEWWTVPSDPYALDELIGSNVTGRPSPARPAADEKLTSLPGVACVAGFSRRPLPELAAVLGVWRLSQAAECAADGACWRMSGDAAVPARCTAALGHGAVRPGSSSAGAHTPYGLHAICTAVSARPA